MDTNDPPERAIARVSEWMSRLIFPDQVVELRALNVQDGTRWPQRSTLAGTFRGYELHELAVAALKISGLCAGVYFTLNPLKPSRFVRQAPRLQKAHGGQLASDADVHERQWLLIDVDPVKPKANKDDSATDLEKARTLELVRKIQAYIGHDTAATPIVADSGNGHHLLYRLSPSLPVELPLREDDPLKMALVHLAAQFSGELGLIDTKVFNPSRIVKFPGTMSCKGESTEARPHRRARILEMPNE
jgi:hypothetical protein